MDVQFMAPVRQQIRSYNPKKDAFASFAYTATPPPSYNSYLNPWGNEQHNELDPAWVMKS
jgi:hypothetical protein